MYKFFNIIGRNLIFVISTAMLFGFVYGLIFPVDFLRSFILPCAFFAIYPMMVNLQIEKVFKGRDIKLQFTSQLLNLFVVPFIAFGIGLKAVR